MNSTYYQTNRYHVVAGLGDYAKKYMVTLTSYFIRQIIKLILGMNDIN